MYGFDTSQAKISKKTTYRVSPSQRINVDILKIKSLIRIVIASFHEAF